MLSLEGEPSTVLGGKLEVSLGQDLVPHAAWNGRSTGDSRVGLPDQLMN